MNQVNIYALIDPRDGRCRYVGKTKNDLEKRLRGHINDAKRRPGEIARFRWINALAKSGVVPLIKTLEVVSPDDWQAAEQMWIHEMRARFPGLLNGTDGGDGIHGYQHSMAARRKIAEAHKALNSNIEHRLATSASVKAAFATDRGQAALKEAARKRWTDPEYRRKVVEGMRAAAGTDEARARTRALHTGKSVSQEARDKISLANKGKRRTDEQRKALSELRRGRRYSEEAKAKMRAAITPEMKAASAERLRQANLNRTPEQKRAISDRMKAIWKTRKEERLRSKMTDTRA